MYPHFSQDTDQFQSYKNSSSCLSITTPFSFLYQLPSPTLTPGNHQTPHFCRQMVTQTIAYTYDKILLDNKKAMNSWYKQLRWLFKELYWLKKTSFFAFSLFSFNLWRARLNKSIMKILKQPFWVIHMRKEASFQQLCEWTILKDFPSIIFKPLDVWLTSSLQPYERA